MFLAEELFDEIMTVELLTVNDGNKPIELILREKPRLISSPSLGRAELSFTQATDKQPDAMLIPQQNLDVRAYLVDAAPSCHEDFC